MKTTLTVVGIEKLKAGTYWDSVCKGLHLRVGKNRKTWQYKYRQGDKQLRPVIGHFPKMGLADARKAAGEINDRLDLGTPIILHEVTQHPRAEKVVTLGNLLDKYEAYRRVGGGKRIKSLDRSMQALRYNLDAYVGLPAKQFKKTDLRKVREDIQARGAMSAANRFLSYMSTFMRWGVDEDHFEANFCTLRKTTENAREVFLNEEEIRAVWHACNVMENAMGNIRATRSFARLIRYQICVPSRKGESATMRLEDVTQHGYWRMGDHKTAEIQDNEHVLLLPPLARAQLGEGSKDHGNGAPDQLCFPGHRHGKPLSGWSKMMKELRLLAGIDKHFTIHDLRRTGASRMQKMGIRQDYIDMVLNHAVKGVGGVYMQDQMTEWKAETLRLWNDELQRIIDNRPLISNVIPMVMRGQAAA